MNSYTADPANPRGRRSGSLVASGTHDGHLVVDADGAHDVDESEDETISATAQAAGAGATELAAWIAAREEQIEEEPIEEEPKDALLR